jgi:hypothetical protein
MSSPAAHLPSRPTGSQKRHVRSTTPLPTNWLTETSCPVDHSPPDQLAHGNVMSVSGPLILITLLRTNWLTENVLSGRPTPLSRPTGSRKRPSRSTNSSPANRLMEWFARQTSPVYPSPPLLPVRPTGSPNSSILTPITSAIHLLNPTPQS